MGKTDCLNEKMTYILGQYGFQLRGIKEHKSIYKLETTTGFFALKEIKFPEDEFCYIYAAMEHLAAHGFSDLNRLIVTKNYYPFAEYKNKRYALSSWIEGSEADYRKKSDLKIAAKTLALLHKAARGFTPPDWGERIKWGSWPQSMQVKMEELTKFRSIANQRISKSLFDRIFLAHVDYYINECQRALDYFSLGDYTLVNEKEAANNFFCHHDFAHHNVIIDKNRKGHVIDFDYCISDVRCHDLGSLILRVLKKNNWRVKPALIALDKYRQVRKVSSQEVNVMKILLRFPQDFWQVAFAYYMEQNQSEERLLRKLTRWVLDKHKRKKSLHKLAKLK